MAGDEPDKKAQENPQPRESAHKDDPVESETAPEAADGQDDQGDAQQRMIQEAVEAALAEQKDTVLRAQAEVQNMRRRCEQDVERAHKFALEKFAGELLPVVDNLERALQAVSEADQDSVHALKEGVELTLKGFLETLEKFNIEQIDPESEPFDPQLHEAITMQPSDDLEPNTVMAVIQKGYTLNSRVIRPARVMVSKAVDKS